MPSKIYKFLEHNNHFLAIMARPMPEDRLDEDIASLSKLGVNTIISFLEKSESDELGLQNELQHCIDKNINFFSLPIRDRGVPESINAYTKFCKEMYSLFINGQNIVAHCRGGIGRAGIFATALLIIHGIEPNLAFPHVSKVRGVQIPDTEDQKKWLIDKAHYFKK